MAAVVNRRSLMDIVLEQRVIGIVRTASAATARQSSVALLEAGLRAVEVSLTTPGALDVVAELAARPDGGAVGAGTVLDAATARDAVAAGARFLVSPAVVEEVLVAAREADIAVFPGVATPTEMVMAMRWGADGLKLFPASAFAPAWVRDVRQALPGARLIPTGGVSIQSASAWIAAGAIAVGMGGALTRGGALEVRDRVRGLLGDLAAAVGT